MKFHFLVIFLIAAALAVDCANKSRPVFTVLSGFVAGGCLLLFFATERES